MFYQYKTMSLRGATLALAPALQARVSDEAISILNRIETAASGKNALLAATSREASK